MLASLPPKEPVGLCRSDGKRPDGLHVTVIPWSSGKSAVWDVTVVDTLAKSYLHLTSREASGAAEASADRKLDKYKSLDKAYEVVPIAFETFGPSNEAGSVFINCIGNKLSQISGYPGDFFPVAKDFHGYTAS